MATRRLKPEDWSPVYQTRISTRVAHEPRDECVRIPSKSERALRPKPPNIPPRQLQSPPELKGPPPSRKESSEYGDILRDPEIVDVAPPGTWPRRESPAHRQQRKQSPSITSQYSTRQSEISLGILDYYIRDRTPSRHSPEPPTPKLDPAIEKFDFGLPPTPTPSANPPDPPPADTKPGAERRDQPLIPISPPPAPSNRPPVPPKGYSLFPVIKQVTPPPRRPTVVEEETISLQAITPTTHQQPNPSYRPRKESISTTSGSSRARNDSFIKRTPLRILSSDSTSSTPHTRRQISTASTIQTSSPPSASRWSDDTITSPPSTAGPRTIFGSLLRRESTAPGQGYSYYPDCFFEDDDDEAEPLRRRWRKSPGATTSSGSSGSYGGRKRDGRRKWWRILLCGCGG